jgi:hypothetical protein
VFRDPAPVEVLRWRDEFHVSGATWLNPTTLAIPWPGALRQIDLDKPNVIVEIPLNDSSGANGVGGELVSPVRSPP